MGKRKNNKNRKGANPAAARRKELQHAKSGRSRYLEAEPEQAAAHFSRVHNHVPHIREGRKRGSVVIEHKEIVQEILTNTDEYTLYRWQVNAGISPSIATANSFGGLFTYLATMGSLFQQYRINHMRLTYMPMVPLTKAGMVTMSWESDPSDDGAGANSDAIAILFAAPAAANGQVSQAVYVDVPRRLLDTLGNRGILNIRDADLGDTDSPSHPQYASHTAYADYDAGFFQLLVTNPDAQPAAFGYVAIEYEIELMNPTIQNILAAGPSLLSGCQTLVNTASTAQTEPFAFTEYENANDRPTIWQTIEGGARMVAKGLNDAGSFVSKKVNTITTMLDFNHRNVGSFPGWGTLDGYNGAVPLLLNSLFSTNVASYRYAIEAPVPAQTFFGTIEELPEIGVTGFVGGAASEASMALTEVAPLALLAGEVKRNLLIQRALANLVEFERTHPGQTPPLMSMPAYNTTTIDAYNYIGLRVMSLTHGAALPEHIARYVIDVATVLGAGVEVAALAAEVTFGEDSPSGASA